MQLSLQALRVTETVWQKDSSFRGEITPTKAGPHADTDIHEYHSYKNIVHAFYQEYSTWNNILFSNKNIHRYFSRYTL